MNCNSRYPLFLLHLFFSLFIFSSAMAYDSNVVPYHFISKYYPPKDRYLDEIPTFIMTKEERTVQEDRRFKKFISIYGSEFLPATYKKGKKKPARKKMVMGFYFNRNKNIFLVNVDGEFISLTRLFPGGNVKTLGDYEDIVVINYRHRDYRIEVGKPLPFVR